MRPWVRFDSFLKHLVVLLLAVTDGHVAPVHIVLKIVGESGALHCRLMLILHARIVAFALPRDTRQLLLALGDAYATLEARLDVLILPWMWPTTAHEAHLCGLILTLLDRQLWLVGMNYVAFIRNTFG